MSDSKYTLTKFLWISASNLMKTTITLSIILMIAGGMILSDANIQTYKTTLDSNGSFVRTLDIEFGGDLQIAVYIVDENLDRWDPDKSYEFNTDNSALTLSLLSVEDDKVIYSSKIIRGDIFNLKVDSGMYRINIKNIGTERVEVGVVSSQIEIKALWLTIVLAIVTLISFSLLMMILPFLIFLLIYRAVQNHTPSTDTIVNEKGNRARKSTRGEVLRSNPGSIMVDITNIDKILITAIIFFAMLSVIENNFSIFLLISLVVIYRITQKNSLRVKITNLLYQNGDMTIGDMVTTLQISKKRIVNILNYMSLELGYPILYNGLTGEVKVVGDLLPYLPYSPKSVAIYEKYQSAEQQTNPEIKSGKKNIPLKGKERKESMDCESCGTKLPVSSQFCHNCGAKQRRV